jgi:hypothetical protein
MKKKIKKITNKKINKRKIDSDWLVSTFRFSYDRARTTVSGSVYGSIVQSIRTVSSLLWQLLIVASFSIVFSFIISIIQQ